MDYSVVEKIVKSGNSKVFDNWREHATITEAEFLEALKYLSEDPLDERGRLTREVGLTPQGIIYLDRVYDNGADICVFYHDGFVWDGALFEMKTSEREKEAYGDSVITNFKISLSAWDKI